MSKQFKIQLRSIACSGESIGDDFNFDLNLNDQSISIQFKLSPEETLVLNNTLFEVPLEEISSDQLKIRISGREDDPVFDDRAEDTFLLKLDPEIAEPQFSSHQLVFRGDAKGDRGRLAFLEFLFVAFVLEEGATPQGEDLPLLIPFEDDLNNERFPASFDEPDFDEDRQDREDRDAEEFDEFLFTETGQTLLLDSSLGQPVYLLTGNVGRTVVSERCKFSAFFGLSFRNKGRSKKYKLESLLPEVGVTCNNSFDLRIKVAVVSPEKGTLSIKVVSNYNKRGSFAEIKIEANGIKDLQAKLSKMKAIHVPAPKEIQTCSGDKRILERFTCTVTWTPKGGKACESIVEQLNVRWYIPAGNFTGITEPKVVGGSRPGRKKPYMVGGESVFKMNNGKEGVVIGAPIVIYYPIENIKSCCGKATTHSVIQFVRHIYQLNGFKERSDRWSLDILKSQLKIAQELAKLAKEGKPNVKKLKYDPRFTHAPCKKQGGGNDLVYPGPAPFVSVKNNLAIVQRDAPGISEELHKAFSENGGTFTWEFVSLLVCTEQECDATAYLKRGVVKQMAYYQTRLFFPKPRKQKVWVRDPKKNKSGYQTSLIIKPPVFSSPFFKGKAFDKKKCKNLGELLQEFDDPKKGLKKIFGSRRKPKGKPGKFTEGYTNPRDHKVGVPRRAKK